MVYRKCKHDFCYTRFGKVHYCIQNELFTLTEIEKYKIPNSDKFFDTVVIPKNKTYFCFGVRKIYGEH